LTIKTMKHLTVLVLFTVLLTLGCGGGSGEGGSAAGETSGGLSAEQLEKGIGPISEVDLAELDASLAARGEEVFTLKCTACHKLDERYVGPPLRDVLERRRPEFIMNMILNPDEMVKSHPSVRELLAQYMTQMPNQQLTEEDARAVLEYLRQVAAEKR
jgi:mono/diheme cytochrome c family protein